MSGVRTQKVIDALTGLGFERRMANGSHALYAHPAGASVTIPHGQPYLSDALFRAIERQVTGFGIAPADVFGATIFTGHGPAGEAQDTTAAEPAPGPGDRPGEGRGVASASTRRSRRAVAT